MYETFYGFKRRPFSLNPDPDFLYLSEKHRTALSLLEYSLLNQAAFSVITGEIGTGKTTLIRYLLHHMEANFSVGLITNTHQNFGELLQWTLMAFGLEYREKGKVELYQILYDFLIQEYAQNRQTLLIIDEAQNLGSEALEELRMLSNINTDDNQLLQMILVGQPGLCDLLKRPELEQFAQRIAVDYHLKSLSQKETYEYIYHRIAVAGGQPLELFGREACEAIFLYSQGTPRLINLLLDTALVYGFAEEERQIRVKLIHQVVQDKQRGGIFPLRAQAIDIQEAKANGELDDKVPWPPEYISTQEEIIETMLDQIGHSIVEDEEIEELAVSWKEDEKGSYWLKTANESENIIPRKSGKYRGEPEKPQARSNEIVPRKVKKDSLLKTLFVTTVAGLSIIGIFFLGTFIVWP
jgi:general secretion pathway protein A